MLVTVEPERVTEATPLVLDVAAEPSAVQFPDKTVQELLPSLDVPREPLLLKLSTKVLEYAGVTEEEASERGDCPLL
jgi:hypothetical protein